MSSDRVHNLYESVKDIDTLMFMLALQKRILVLFRVKYQRAIRR